MVENDVFCVVHVYYINYTEQQSTVCRMHFLVRFSLCSWKKWDSLTNIFFTISFLIFIDIVLSIFLNTKLNSVKKHHNVNM